MLADRQVHGGSERQHGLPVWWLTYLSDAMGTPTYSPYVLVGFSELICAKCLGGSWHMDRTDSVVVLGDCDGDHLHPFSYLQMYFFTQCHMVTRGQSVTDSVNKS
jgi:hypothetical protein